MKKMVMSEWTVAEIKKALDKLKVDYSGKKVKADLFTLLLDESKKVKPKAKKKSKKAQKAISKSKKVAKPKKKRRVVKRRKTKSKEKKTKKEKKKKYTPTWSDNLKEKVEVIEPGNVFSTGVLCHLRIRRWSASAKLDADFLEERDLPAEIIKGTQTLLAPNFLDEVKANRKRARKALYQNSLWFPVDGLFFVPKAKLEEINAIFEECKERDDQLIDEMLASYDEAVKDYQKKFPKFFNASKYPDKETLRTKFQFSWTFRTFTVPDQEMQILSPEVYKQEEKKFKAEMEEMMTQTMTIVANSLLKRVDRLRSQCVEDKVNAKTYNGVNKILDNWDRLWGEYVGHKQLRDAINKTKKAMLSVTDAGTLKDSERVREQFGKKMETIAKQLENIPDVKRKRKLMI